MPYQIETECGGGEADTPGKGWWLMARAKKYRSRDGDYLVVDEDKNGLFRIWWYIAEWGDTGACLGEVLLRDVEPSDRDAWESWQADRIAAPLADGSDAVGCYFESKRKAVDALRVVNEGLFVGIEGGKAWPTWAVKARAEGWTPPKGWMP